MKETKVYVDELPKSCWDCFCQDNENGRCKILEKYTDYVPKDCPLIDIKAHDREVVKEVCEKIKLKFSDTRSHNWGIEQIELYDFLDQIQKEAENE